MVVMVDHGESWFWQSSIIGTMVLNMVRFRLGCERWLSMEAETQRLHVLVVFCPALVGHDG